MTLLEHIPDFDTESAQTIAAEHFGIDASAKALPSERDQNFLLTAESGEKFVLKISNASEDLEFIEAQNSVLKHLAKRVSFCQHLAPASSGEELVTVRNHLVRMVHFLPGLPLAEIKPQSEDLLRDLGRKLGELDRTMADFDHPAVHRSFDWDLANGNRVIDEYSDLIADAELREMVRTCRVNLKDGLRRSVIHGDANDYNVLVDPDRREVTGLIDFGDMVYSYTVGNLAIAIAYVVLDKDDPVSAAACVVDGYEREFLLMDDEREVLWDLVRLRMAMSVCMAAKQQREQPENEYLSISQQAITKTLPVLNDEFPNDSN